jgi:hypothetical protein
MSTLNTEPTQRPLRTADLAATGSRETTSEEQGTELPEGGERLEGRERLEPLFQADLADEYRARWTAVQGSFVDDPREAVQQGDELVAQVMKSLAESFAHERDALENQLSGGGEASTEMLRVALRRYRSFFERLLSL